MKRTFSTVMLSLVMPVLWSGCGGTDPPPAADPPDLGSVDSSSGRPSGSAAAQADTSQDVAGPNDHPPPSPPVTAVEVLPDFDPPFPERVDLFAIPNRQRSIEKQSGTNEQSIELKGFVNVGKRRAVLAINGVTSPIAVGETRHGVEVVAIEPPRVVLQRGRSRWTTSLAEASPTRLPEWRTGEWARQ